MIGYTTLDLSLLPPPQAVEQWSFDRILADSQTSFLSYWATARASNPALRDYNVQALKSNPVNFVLSAGAFREGLLRQRVNEAVLAVMWASAERTDLDQLGALVGLARRTITPADPTTSPPTPAVMESDAEFKARGPFALDATAIGYAGGTYRSIVLAAAPEVKAVTTVRSGAGQIALILQGRGPDGSVADDVVARVRAIIFDNDQLTDIVSVRSATPKPYQIVANAQVPPGPATAPVKAASEAALAAMAAALQVVGRTIGTDALIAAGRVPPMIKFQLVSPDADFIVAPDEISYPTQIIVNVTALNG